MNWTILVSAVTAFIITAGGSLVVVLVGGKPSVWQILSACGLGAVAAGKDVRSLLKLPPVDGNGSAKSQTQGGQ